MGQDRQTAEKEELAASTAAKIRYQMGERERERERGRGGPDLNGAIRHLLACDADKNCGGDSRVGLPDTLKPARGETNTST